MRVIVLDIDGTLVNRQKVMTPKTKEALLEAQQRGDKLILASGRPVSGLMDLVQELNMEASDGVIIAYNGAKAINLSNHEVLCNTAMDKETVKRVLQHCAKFDIIPMVDLGNTMFVEDVYATVTLDHQPFMIVQYEARGGKFLLQEVKSLADEVDFECNKILTAGDPEYLIEHSDEIKAPFEKELSCMFTSAFYFEFTAKGIDKGETLKKVLAKKGWQNAEVIAFGDGHNDASLFHVATTKVAMGNAVDALKAQADVICADNDHDGIAEVLQQLKN